ncbi:hypothetical protein FBUS_11218 [Fasciolopsis buskii]|uniref:Apple domain-containing protein n=1 Tax=Fasciolopsis buskii TaxID=27845 RepID=A0A8E0RVF1_9TREM|nr:hypothetical protein FBUS_11218 [Fasciolopsis buski]
MTVLVALNFILLHFLLNLHHTQCPCPTGFVEVATNTCMLVTQMAGSYCNAHAYCESEGVARGLRLFVPAKQAGYILQLVPIMSVVFTGLSKTLNRSTNYKSGWRYTDPGMASFVTDSSDTSIPWGVGEPNQVYELIADYYLGSMCDTWQFSSISSHVICQLSTRPWDTSTNPFQMDWPYTMPYMFLQDGGNEGCFESWTVNSIYDCCNICKGRRVCRSFYYHKQTAQCWMSLYIDSLLPGNLSVLGGTWFRLARVNW